MSWKRLATFGIGGALVVVGFVVPAAGAALIPAGTGLLGLATRWPGDRPAKPRPGYDEPDSDVTPTPVERPRKR